MIQSSRSTLLRTGVAVVSTGCLVLLAACTGGHEGGSTTAELGTGADHTTAASSPSAGIPVTRARRVTVYDANFTGDLAAQRRPNRLWSGSTTNLGWLNPR